MYIYILSKWSLNVSVWVLISHPPSQTIRNLCIICLLHFSSLLFRGVHTGNQCAVRSSCVWTVCWIFWFVSKILSESWPSCVKTPVTRHCSHNSRQPPLLNLNTCSALWNLPVWTLRCGKDLFSPSTTRWKQCWSVETVMLLVCVRGLCWWMTTCSTAACGTSIVSLHVNVSVGGWNWV